VFGRVKSGARAPTFSTRSRIPEARTSSTLHCMSAWESSGRLALAIALIASSLSLSMPTSVCDRVPQPTGFCAHPWSCAARSRIVFVVFRAARIAGATATWCHRFNNVGHVFAIGRGASSRARERGRPPPGHRRSRAGLVPGRHRPGWADRAWWLRRAAR
jgi:hypothetical protein